MSDAKKRRRRGLAVGVGVGVAIFGALFATALSVGSGIGGAPKAEPAAEAGEKDWAGIAGSALATGAFGFATAGFERGVLTVSGDAPDAEARVRAFSTAQRAVLDDPAHVGQVLAFDNAITVGGIVQAGAPDAASALGEAPAAEACQTAYNTLLDGRVINFESGSAVLDSGSRPLLDALSDVAQRCTGYRVEVGGHTDGLGDATANQALSERRAQSVADYLVGRGVAAAQLGVIGYGETAPLDAAGTAEADAKNRRIEFKVMQGG